MTLALGEWPAVNSNLLFESLFCDTCEMKGMYPEWFQIDKEIVNRLDKF